MNIYIYQLYHYRITTKQYSLIQSSYQTVFSLSQLLANISKHFFGHLNRQKILKQKIPK